MEKQEPMEREMKSGSAKRFDEEREREEINEPAFEQSPPRPSDPIPSLKFQSLGEGSSGRDARVVEFHEGYRKEFWVDRLLERAKGAVSPQRKVSTRRAKSEELRPRLTRFQVVQFDSLSSSSFLKRGRADQLKRSRFEMTISQS